MSQELRGQGEVQQTGLLGLSCVSQPHLLLLKDCSQLQGTSAQSSEVHWIQLTWSCWYMSMKMAPRSRWPMTAPSSQLPQLKHLPSQLTLLSLIEVKIFSNHVMFLYSLFTDGKPKIKSKIKKSIYTFIEINCFYVLTKVTFEFNVL